MECRKRTIILGGSIVVCSAIIPVHVKVIPLTAHSSEKDCTKRADARNRAGNRTYAKKYFLVGTVQSPTTSIEGRDKRSSQNARNSYFKGSNVHRSHINWSITNHIRWVGNWKSRVVFGSIKDNDAYTPRTTPTHTHTTSAHSRKPRSAIHTPKTNWNQFFNRFKLLELYILLGFFKFIAAMGASCSVLRNTSEHPLTTNNGLHLGDISVNFTKTLNCVVCDNFCSLRRLRWMTTTSAVPDYKSKIFGLENIGKSLV